MTLIILMLPSHLYVHLTEQQILKYVKFICITFLLIVTFLFAFLQLQKYRKLNVAKNGTRS